MSNEDVAAMRFRYKSWITVIAVFTAGLLLLVFSQTIVADSVNHSYQFAKLFLEHLATALLAGACISGLYEYFLRSEFLETTAKQTTLLTSALDVLSAKLKAATDASEHAVLAAIESTQQQSRKGVESIGELLAASREQTELGISHCFLEVDSYDYSEILQASRDLIVILNDGRGLISNYYERFVRRLQRQDYKTTIILLHPDSQAVELHAAKVGSTALGLRNKIAETVHLLKKANSVDGNLRILGHDTYTTMSVFLTEKEAIITPYFLSKVRRTPPLFAFVESGRESFYSKLKDDVNALILDCEDISSYVSTEGAPVSALRKQGPAS